MYRRMEHVLQTHTADVVITYGMELLTTRPKLPPLVGEPV